MAKPTLKSLPYASHITNLLHIKNIPLGNWEMTVPTVTPINMAAVNKMITAGTLETLTNILYHDPPPANLEYTQNAITKLLKAKKSLLELGKDIDHVPEYSISTKRQSRPRPSSSIASPPPSSVPPTPRRETREDRVLDALARHSEYTHRCLTQLHEENEFLSKKIEDSYHSLEAMYSFSTIPPPLPPIGGFPFMWPPSGYSTVFPRRAADIPGSSGTGPSGAAATDGAGPSGVAADAAGTSGSADPDAGPSSAAGDDTTAGDQMEQ